MSYRVIVIGASMGGFNALSDLLNILAVDFPLPILIVMHLHETETEGYAHHLGRETKLRVIEPCDKQIIQPGWVYTAPSNYHLLLNRDGSIALSVDPKVNWSRPSIDVLFESAAQAWPNQVIAVLLSGANSDGTKGMFAVRQKGGYNIVQDPVSAVSPVMPQSAINAGVVDQVMDTKTIGKRLIELSLLDH